MCTYFKAETDAVQNLIGDFFFLILSARGPFHKGRTLIEKKYGGTGLIWKKRKFCKQSLTKERKQLPVVIQQQAIFYEVFVLCLWL